ncbi:MAG: hypothetical protein FJ358_07100 [Thaumarchaeota archaeon]|nr:hypothetical protein [Nitrososphaerota archaeon]
MRQTDASNLLRVIALKTWPHVDYSVIEADLCRYSKEYPIFQLGVDATNEISFSERLQTLGLPVKPLRFTSMLKHEMVSDVLLFMSHEKVAIPSHGAEELVSQIREQERIISQAGTILYGHPQGRHDDLFWAFAVMVHVAKPDLLGIDNRIYPI